MSDFASLMKELGNSDAVVVDDGIDGDVTGYIDTGSYSFNALLSGSIYGGIANNRIIALAGDPSTGKSFYAIGIVSQFLIDNPEGFVFYFETENAMTKKNFVERGCDVGRVALVPVFTVQEFRTQALKVINKYLGMPEDERKPMLFVLDSLGNLSTDKEMKDTADGKDTRDMTRAQLLRAAFRVLTLKLGKAKVPLVFTNHTYSVQGSYVPTKVQSGGEGGTYAASTIVFLSKSKASEGEGEARIVKGAIITARLQKSRLTIENKKVKTLLHYSKGLDKYYGLLDLAVKFGVIKKVSTRLELPNGEKAFEKTILNNPEKFFTKDVLDLIDEKCKEEFLYGKSNLTGDIEEDDE